MKILIADDHSLIREGLKKIIKEMPKVCAVDEAVDGDTALSMIKQNSYDVIILDISMPGLSGMEILNYLNIQKRTTPVLMVSFHPPDHYAMRAFKLGAAGYISKGNLATEIAVAIKKVAEGGKYIQPEFAEKIAFDSIDDNENHMLDKLSDREFQVMRLIASGISIKEISERLYISHKTVSTYRARILSKLNMSSNADITNYAVKNQLVE